MLACAYSISFMRCFPARQPRRSWGVRRLGCAVRFTTVPVLSPGQRARPAIPGQGAHTKSFYAPRTCLVLWLIAIGVGGRLRGVGAGVCIVHDNVAACLLSFGD